MGKCFLQKKLANDEGQQQSPDKPIRLTGTDFELFLHKEQRINLDLPLMDNRFHFFNFNSKLPQYYPSVFQPPQC